MSSKPDLVLLNPPAAEITIRDNYCSKVSQGSYINHPIDLVVQSGFLREQFQLHLVDAIVEKLSVRQCLDSIRKIDPVCIYSLAGNASWAEDKRFLATLRKEMPNTLLAAGGDVFLEDPVSGLRELSYLDAVVTDYCTPDLLRYFGDRGHGRFKQIVHRESGNIVDGREPVKEGSSFEIPVPEHMLFCRLDYRYPFVRNRKFATVITEYGCPFKCSFCVMGTLGYKLRPVENVMTELEYLSQMGIRDIFFVDQSFGSRRDRSLELCSEIRARCPRLRWVCFSRVDIVDRAIMQIMKSAGCHTVILGVESASEELLKDYRKGYSLDKIREAFRIARSLKIRTVATFLLGLPGETWESACRTIEFARELNCDFASLNVAVPRMGTEMRKQAVAKGYIDPDLQQFDQSGTEVVMQTETLTRDQLVQLKRKAVRDIYLRPGYIFRRLTALRSWDEFIIHAREGYNLFSKFLCKHHE